MADFLFSKFLPGGNATILLHEPALTRQGLAEASARLMREDYLQAEQVGALLYPKEGEQGGTAAKHILAPRLNCAHLEMMGGEFCVNATRSAAMLLALEGRLAFRLIGRAKYAHDTNATGKYAWSGELTVSGVDAPVRVLVAENAVTFDCAVASDDESVFSEKATRRKRESEAELPQTSVMICGARVFCGKATIQRQTPEAGLCLMRMPGMTHLLIDTTLHPLPETQNGGWKETALAWRKKFGLEKEPACGVIWHARHGRGYRIWPAVAVQATGSEYMETACGSASLALYLCLVARSRAKNSARAPLDILQPSGEFLRVVPALSPGSASSYAWICGSVRLVAQGSVFLH